MRVTKEELRRIVRTAVKRKLEERLDADHMWASQDRLFDMGDALGGMIADHLQSEKMTYVESMLVNNPTDEMIVPARYEDVEAYAEVVASRATALLRAHVEDICVSVFNKLMKPE